MTQTAATPEAGRQAAVLGRWKDAYAQFHDVDPSALTGQDLEAYAESAFWTCRQEEAMALRERAFAAYVTEGQPLLAATVASWLSWDHSARGSFAVAQGWLARADRLLAPLPESPEHAWVALTHIMGAAESGDSDGVQTHLARALDIAERLGVGEVLSIARTIQGRMLVHRGEVDAGLALLDEAAASALSGELRPFSAGLIYCMTIEACQEVGDLRRAAEWTDVANRFCDRLDVSGFPGACRIHRAQTLRLTGNWSAAEEQAITACEELREFNYWVTGNGLYEVAEIRRVRGDSAAALETYREVHDLGRDPQPGLALLRLAEGKAGAAGTAVRRSLEATPEPLKRLQLLPAQVEIAIAAGDLRTARAARDEIEATVTSYLIAHQVAPAFEATLAMANARIALADGDGAAAVGHLRVARDRWLRVGAPYDVAQARLHLGIAYRRQGDEEGATAELESALATFERLGARPDEERVRRLLGRLETRRTFVFTDIVGSTRLLESLGDAKWRRLLARHDELVRGRIADAGGEVVKQTGDGFFAAFDQPEQALEAAVAIQRALDGEVVAPDVRIGVHTGGAFHTDAADLDYGGLGVHVAARVGALAAAGEILASSESLEGVGGTWPRSEPREVELKGLVGPVSVVAVDWR